MKIYANVDLSEWLEDKKKFYEIRGDLLDGLTNAVMDMLRKKYKLPELDDDDIDSLVDIEEKFRNYMVDGLFEIFDEE